MRLKILEKQLERRPWRRFDLKEFAQKTAGTSPAKIRRSLTKRQRSQLQKDERSRKVICGARSSKAGGKDRPLFEPVGWSDLGY